MRKTLAIIASKTTISILRVFRRSASALPGVVAQKIDKDILNHLTAGNFTKGIIVITGTNGKTTTAKLVSDMLTNAGIDHIHNRSGSNLPRGILSELIQKCTLTGKISSKMAVFELDEAYIEQLIPVLKPSVLVITNLFRDQLDRFGELDKLANNFKRAVSRANHDMKLVLNADDPLVASMRENNIKNTVLFGVSDYNGPKIEHDYTEDSIFDMKSGKKLQYSQRYFGHIGIYSTDNDLYTRQKPQINVTKMGKIGPNGSEYVVDTTTQSFSIKSSLPGMYNIYNSLACIAVADILSVKPALVSKTLESSNAAFGRAETFTYSGISIRMLLIKNPTGFNQIIQTYLLDSSQDTPLLIAINDNIADGRDVSWLWDVAIEDIAKYKGKIVITGVRAYDMALRLKYAGVDESKIVIERDIRVALDEFVAICRATAMQGYILPTYTAMLALRNVITIDDKSEKDKYYVN